MTDAVEILLRSHWLPTLGQMMGQLTPLSPLGVGTPQGDHKGELQASGLLDVEGNVQERFQPILRGLARPTRLARLRYAAPDRQLEYQAFFNGDGEPVGMVSTEDGFRLDWPASPGTALSVVAEYAGVSSDPQIAVVLELPVLEARVALALVDATRQQFLVKTTMEEEPTVALVTPEAIAERLVPEAGHLNRLETLYRELEVPDTPLDAGAVGYALSSLAGKGLTQHQEGAYAAAGYLLDLAANLLLVNGFFQFDAVEGTQAGQVDAGRGIVVQGGPRALLLMQHDAGQIKMTGLTGEAFYAMVGPLFGAELAEGHAEAQPAEVHAPPATPEPAPAPEAAASPKFCGKCGKPVDAGMKFCGKCGNPMG